MEMMQCSMLHPHKIVVGIRIGPDLIPYAHSWTLMRFERVPIKFLIEFCLHLIEDERARLRQTPNDLLKVLFETID